MLKALVIDDGVGKEGDIGSRRFKTMLYQRQLTGKGCVVDRKILGALKPSDLLGYDMIVADLDGIYANTGHNHSTINTFLGLVNEAFSAQPNYPAIAILSGEFQGNTGDVSFAGHPHLEQKITTVCSNRSTDYFIDTLKSLQSQKMAHRPEAGSAASAGPVPPSARVQPQPDGFSDRRSDEGPKGSPTVG